MADQGLIFGVDIEHIWRILGRGCPATFNWEEPAANKAVFIRRGNHPAVKNNWPVVNKNLNKEEIHNHVLPFPRWFVSASPNAHRVPKNIIPGKEHLLNPDESKKARLVWDGSTKVNWWETTMNEVTPMSYEGHITFGYVYIIHGLLHLALQLENYLP